MPNNVAVDFTIGQRQAVETEFTLDALPMKVSQLENDLDFQTKDEVDTALEGKQDVLTAGEGIAIEDNVISATGATITIDDELSTTSENPVQNKVVTSAINQNHTEIGNIGQTIGTYGDIVTHNVNEFATASQGSKADSALQSGDNISELNNNAGYITSSALSGYATETYVDTADQNLQGQIDAIVASSDVYDIVGTYAELQAYDISTVPVNDIIKVLVDSTHENAATYYRCVETDGVKSWTYIGTEGAYYTKAQSDARFATAAQGALADTAVQPSDLATVATSGSYNDLLNKPTIPTVNNATLTIQKNGVDVQTFTANASTNATANITVPTDTGDLTNGAGYITGITSGDVTTALGYTPYSDANPNGYTSNVGTVTSVNNTSPDSNGNVTLSIPAAQVNSDWNASSGVAEILNKPTIPTVNDATITITQGGVTKGSFTLNQASGDTIALDAGGGGGSYTAGTGIDITSNTISVTSPTLTNNTTKGLSILGTSSNTTYTTSIGLYASALGQGSIAISDSYGTATASGLYGTCVGGDSNATGIASTAFGSHAKSTANYAIQLGYGTNSEASSFYVSTSTSNNWKMLGSDGKIPSARLSAFTGADGVNAGVLGAVPAPTATDNTKFLRGDGTWASAGGGSSYTAGTGIDITSNTISVTSPTLTNTATGSNSLTILGTANAGADGMNIGSGSKGGRSCVVIGRNATTGILGTYNLAIGYNSEATANIGYSVSLGNEAKTSAKFAIQLGYGTNSEANSFYVGTSDSNNWKMLGSDGLIPAGRIPISTSVDSTSTNSTVVGAKLFYDTCGDIETLINAL